MKLALLIAFLLLAGGAAPAGAQPLRPFPDWALWLGGGWLGDDASRLPDLSLPSPATAESHALDDLTCDLFEVPPGGHFFQLGGDYSLLLRERRPDQSQDYLRHGQMLSWSWRRGPRWMALRLRKDTTDLRQRNVHSDDDRLEADRNGDAWRLAAGRRYGRWDVQLSAGRGRGWEGSVAIGRRGRHGCWQVSGGIDRPDWYAEQTFEGNRFGFPFPLRRERLSVRLAPANWRLPRTELLREVIKGEPDRGSGDFNQPFGQRQRGELRWDNLPCNALLVLSCESGLFDLKMFADGETYLDLPELDFRTLRAVAASPPGPLGLRLILGAEQHQLAADEGWLEPWPFTFWDVFTNNRYRLTDLNYRLDIWSAGLSRRFGHLDLTLTHGWLDGGGDFHYEERVPIVWPFLFTWEPHHKHLSRPAGSILRLDLAGNWPLSETLSLRGAVTQVVPLGAGEDGGGSGDQPPPPPPPGDGDYGGSTYGGLRVRLAVAWSLP